MCESKKIKRFPVRLVTSLDPEVLNPKSKMNALYLIITFNSSMFCKVNSFYCKLNCNYLIIHSPQGF